MNSYSKIRHSVSDLPSEPNPSFSPITRASENPFDAKRWSYHGAGTLRRSRSSASRRLSGEEQSHAVGLQAAVRRAFSMKGSSFGDNGYWRIHGRSDRFLAEEEDEGELRREKARHARKGSRRKGLIGLCKKLVWF